MGSSCAGLVTRTRGSVGDLRGAGRSARVSVRVAGRGGTRAAASGKAWRPDGAHTPDPDPTATGGVAGGHTPRSGTSGGSRGGLAERGGDAFADPLGDVAGDSVPGLHGLLGPPAEDDVVGGEPLCVQLLPRLDHPVVAVLDRRDARGRLVGVACVRHDESVVVALR